MSQKKSVIFKHLLPVIKQYQQVGFTHEKIVALLRDEHDLDLVTTETFKTKVFDYEKNKDDFKKASEKNKKIAGESYSALASYDITVKFYSGDGICAVLYYEEKLQCAAFRFSANNKESRRAGANS